MSKKIIVNRNEAMEKVLKGIEESANFITSTMGPGGKLVCQAPSEGQKLKLTKDGVSAAKYLGQSPDPLVNCGIALVKEAAQQMLKNVGDGTTTVVAILNSLVKKCHQLSLAGYNPNIIKKALDNIAETMCKEIEKIKKPIEVHSAELQKVAHVASNAEKSISENLTKLIQKLGNEFVILVEESKTGSDEIVLRDGFSFDKGVASPGFFLKHEEQTRSKIEIDNALVMVLGEKFSNIGPMIPLIEKIVASGRPMLIVSEDFDESILQIFLANKIARNLNYVCVKAPLFGDKRQGFLEDLAMITGGSVINPSQLRQEEIMEIAIGSKKGNISIGEAKKVVVTKNETTVVEGKYDEEDKRKRIEVVKGLIDGCTSTYEMEKLKERLGRLQNGIGVFQVGGRTEMEIAEKKDRVEDAIHACRNAVNGGIVPGAGCEFLWCANVIEKLSNQEEITTVMKLIVKDSFEIIARQIIDNTNLQSSDVMLYKIKEMMKEGKYNFGFNGHSGQIEDLMQCGIINPAKVSMEAINIAKSIVKQIIDMGPIIHDIQEESKPTPSYGGGMPGMM